MKQKKLATFRIDADEWVAFQEWARRSGTNASAILVNYIEECLERTPTRFSHFPIERMNKNIDKRLDNIEERLKLLETSLEARIQKEVQQQIAISNQEFMQKHKINEVS
ncbi:hypothetical protein IQ264_07810 [Phormidium sp. LEGE 05292]|uniref:hypothetical protein n=1 Tax=[Phormidium] sp. LEGE 05292 TaxID=767427 RepID=UPI00188210D3|nr:hypothetical protein [Phormidium sp. LEGE 05292]MBE9225336.1 hypothetical protein [Phormidium sp. LEGE 05292]